MTVSLCVSRGRENGAGSAPSEPLTLPMSDKPAPPPVLAQPVYQQCFHEMPAR